MKKTFKKFLGGAMATVMIASSLTVGMVSTAFAADGDAFTILPSDFHTGNYSETSTKIDPDKTSVTKEGVTVALKSGKNYYYSYGTQAKATNSTGKTFTSELVCGGSRTLTFTPVESGTVTVYWYDTGDKSVTVGSNTAVKATDKVVTSDSASCTKDTAFTVSMDTSVVFLEMDFTPTPKGTGYITGTVKGIVAGEEPTGTFKCNGTAFTVDTTTGAYTIDKLTNGDYTITYDGSDYSMDEVKVTVTDQTSATTKDLTINKLAVVDISGTVNNTDGVALPPTATVKLTYGSTATTSAISDENAFSFEGIPANAGSATLSVEGADRYTVNPTTLTIADSDITNATVDTALNIATGVTVENSSTDANTIKYDFTNYNGELLVSTDKTATTPYYYNSKGYTDNIKVSLDSKGANLNDTVDSDTLYMVAPFGSAVSTGTVTVTANVTIPAAGKWSVMSVGNSQGTVAAIRSDSNKKLGLALAGDPVATLESAYSAGTYEVQLVFDLDKSTVTGYVDGTKINSTNIAADTSISYAQFITAGGSRSLTVKDVTIEFANDNVTKTTSYDAPAIVKDGDNFYVVSVIKSDSIATATAVTQALTNGTLDTTDTVYKNVVIGGTEYTAASLFDNATADDYIFASIIVNDNGNATATTLQSGVTTVVG